MVKNPVTPDVAKDFDKLKKKVRNLWWLLFKKMVTISEKLKF
jgi:hypothetical protein